MIKQNIMCFNFIKACAENDQLNVLKAMECFESNGMLCFISKHAQSEPITVNLGGDYMRRVDPLLARLGGLVFYSKLTLHGSGG